MLPTSNTHGHRVNRRRQNKDGVLHVDSTEALAEQKDEEYFSIQLSPWKPFEEKKPTVRDLKAIAN